MATRRSLLKSAASGLALGATPLLARLASAGLPAGATASERLEALPGKQPLIKRSYRPPNYETPIALLDDVITPSERFFVRWHHANIPAIDAATWRLAIGGDALARPLELSLAELRQLEPVELVAVCQCSGNRRGLSDPHVAGVQWGLGAIGNARWKGVRLKDLLARAGLAADAVEIAFAGSDAPPLPGTPPFEKSIPAWKAMDESVLVAYEMNGAAVPHWNGYPARLVVPGWTATYWLKQLTRIRALKQPLASFWVNTAYRIPKGKFPVVDRFVSQESETTTPITEILVNSLITNLADGQRLPAGRPVIVKGLAWDGGYGIRDLSVTLDGGKSWQSAELGAAPGRYSFRPWQYAFTPRATGPLAVGARASSALGTTQTLELIFNGPGYHNNLVHSVHLEIA